MACIILIISAVIPGRRGEALSFGLTISTFLLAVISLVAVWGYGSVEGLYGLAIQDRVSDISKLGICLIAPTVLIYGRTYLEERGLLGGELLALTMLGVVGMMVMSSATHLITIYIGLELMSLCLYALIALDRDSIEATESAMKYFVLGALASGILLYGMSLLYGLTGSLELNVIQASVSAVETPGLPITIALILVIVGLLFKLGVAPFHMWVPDVYEGSPTPITALLASATKIAAFVVVLRVLVVSLGPLLSVWQDMLIAVALLSIGFGNAVAIAQTNIKRMLAYSTISHMGFFLLGILSGTLSGYSAAMLYVMIYAVVSVGTFGCILYLTAEGFEADKLEDYRGLSEKQPWLAFFLLLFMFSLAGIPPTVGFYAKLSILQAVIGAGLLWVAIPSVIFAVVGAFYYLRVVKLMYFDRAEGDGIARRFVPGLNSRALLVLNGLFTVAIMPWVGSISELCRSALSLLNG